MRQISLKGYHHDDISYRRDLPGVFSLGGSKKKYGKSLVSCYESALLESLKSLFSDITQLTVQL